MTEDEWRDALLRAAECGSDCLRDIWVTIPAEMQISLAFVLLKAKILAMGADISKWNVE